MAKKRVGMRGDDLVDINLDTGEIMVPNTEEVIGNIFD